MFLRFFLPDKAWLSLIAYFFLMLAGLNTALAGHPMNVDDAALVTAGSCQLESWFQKNQDSKEWWAVPACNPYGNLELAAGVARMVYPQEEDHTLYVLQGKTLLKPMDNSQWGLAVAAGTQFDNTQHLHGDVFIYFPVSVSFDNGRLLSHLNVGWQHEREGKRHLLTWGVGQEFAFNDYVGVIAEVYGNQQDKPNFQAGFKSWLKKDYIQLDATYGDRLGSKGDASFFSLGLVLVTDVISRSVGEK